jgi:putative FmdB family regulatory protein
MPLYEYACEACGARFERIQKFSDPPVTTCPTCGGSVQKQISSPAFQFKGSGWYITDYARSGQKAGEGSAESSSTGSNSKDAGTKESAGSKETAAPAAASAPSAEPAAPKPSKASTTDTKT